jgi:hypothetical protein
VIRIKEFYQARTLQRRKPFFRRSDIDVSISRKVCIVYQISCSHRRCTNKLEKPDIVIYVLIIFYITLDIRLKVRAIKNLPVFAVVYDKTGKSAAPNYLVQIKKLHVAFFRRWLFCYF